MSKEYITQLKGDYFTSPEYTKLFTEYNFNDVTESYLNELGIYTEIYGNKTYHFVDVPVVTQGQSGFCKARVFVEKNISTSHYSVRFGGIVGEEKEDIFIDSISKALGYTIDYEKPNSVTLVNNIKGILETSEDYDIEKKIVRYIVNKYGQPCYDNHLIELIYVWFEREFRPVEQKYFNKPNKYTTGQNFLVNWDFSELGEMSISMLQQENKPVTSAFNFDNFSEFVNNALSDQTTQDILQTHPFVKVGYGEYQGNFSFLVFYFYKVDNNLFVVSDVDDTKQRYAITYTEYYTMSITGFSGGQPHIDDELHLVSTSGGTTLYNYWHSWDRAHALGAIDIIGWNGIAKPYTIIGIPPRRSTLSNNYPEWPEEDGHRPVADDEPTQDDTWKKPIKPTKIITPTPIVGVPPVRKIDTGDDIELPETDDLSAIGLFTVYKPSYGELVNLGNYLWQEDIVTAIKQMFVNNPMDSIISLHQIYYNPPTTSRKQVKLGYLGVEWGGSAVTSYEVVKRRYTMSCGTKWIESYFNDVRDYQTKVTLFLPFVGFRELDINEVMNGGIKIQAEIDIWNGDIVYNIQLLRRYDNKGKIIATFNGNMCVQIPLTGADKSRLFQNVASIGAGVVATATTGGIGALGLVGAIGGALSSPNINIEKSGGLSGTWGAMAYKKPYLLIERPQDYDASNRQHYIGNPCNITTTVGKVKGYAKFKGVHIDTIPNCSDSERNEIEQLLMTGIII